MMVFSALQALLMIASVPATGSLIQDRIDVEERLAMAEERRVRAVFEIDRLSKAKREVESRLALAEADLERLRHSADAVVQAALKGRSEEPSPAEAAFRDRFLRRLLKHRSLIGELSESLLNERSLWSGLTAQIQEEEFRLSLEIADLSHLLKRREEISSELTARQGRLQDLIPTERARPKSARPTLLWPLRGKLRRAFGQDLSKGIEIEASAGSEVKAVDGGRVIFSGLFEGFGRMIIIRHGSGLVSISANLSESFRLTGDRVRRGEAIGRVANSGQAGAPVVYFELRQNKRAVNPIRYFER